MIEPKTLFIEKRLSTTFKVLPGSGSVTIDVPFVPDYVRIKYMDVSHKAKLDTSSFDLVFTGNPLSPYLLIVYWSVTSGKARQLRYTVAKLASFHNGVK
jgi:hypothetical protein